jgi:hypothetical protein
MSGRDSRIAEAQSWIKRAGSEVIYVLFGQLATKTEGSDEGVALL